MKFVNGRHRAFLLLAGVYVLTYSLFLTKYPLVWMDEPWIASVPWHFLQTGEWTSPMFAGAYAESDTLSNMPMIQLCELPVFYLFGVGPAQARIVTLIFGLLALGAVYAIGAKLWDWRVARIAAVLTICNPLFFFMCRTARYEILVAFFGLCAYYFFTKKTSASIFASGLCVGLAFASHMYGALFAVALTALLFSEHGARFILRRDFWLLFVGTVIPMLLYVAYATAIVSQAPDFAQQASNVEGRFSLFSPDFYISSIKNLPNFFSRVSLAGFLSLLVLFPLFRRGKKMDRSQRSLLQFIVVAAVLFVLLLRSKYYGYTVSFIPFIALLAAPTIAPHLNASPWSWRATSLGVLVVLQLAFTATFIYRYRDADYWTYVRRLRVCTGDGAVLIGEATFWYDHTTEPYYSTHIIPFAIAVRGMTMEQIVQRWKVDYILYDETLASMIDRLSPSQSSEVRTFFRTRCDEVRQIKDNFFGSPGQNFDRTPHTVIVYRPRIH